MLLISDFRILIVRFVDHKIKYIKANLIADGRAHLASHSSRINFSTNRNIVYCDLARVEISCLLLVGSLGSLSLGMFI